MFKTTSSFKELLETSEPFTVILYSSPINPERLRLIEEYGHQNKTPLIPVQSAGFYAYFSVKLPGAFPIVDTHPDETATTDLRLLAPWPELQAFSQDMTKDIENLDNHDHGHLPLVVILLHYLEEWRESHDGANPTKYADKIAFRDLVSSKTRTDNAEGGEENFEEAVGSVMKHIVEPTIPDTLRQVFEYQHQSEVGEASICISNPADT